MQDLCSSLLLLLILSLTSFGLPNPASPPSPNLAPNSLSLTTSQPAQLSTSESSLEGLESSLERSQSFLDIFRAFQHSFLSSQKRAQAFQNNSTASQNKSKIFLARNSSTTSDFSPADLSDFSSEMVDKNQKVVSYLGASSNLSTPMTPSSSEEKKPASSNDTSEAFQSLFSSFSDVEEKSTAKTTSKEKLSRHLASPALLRSNSGDESSSQETTPREQSQTVSEDKTNKSDSSNLQELVQDVCKKRHEN
jgi:hypothetical protein